MRVASIELPVQRGETSHTVAAYAVTPKVSTADGADPTRAQAPSVQEQTIYAEIDADLSIGDVVTWRGEAYRVESEPAVWDNPSPTAPRGCQVDIRRSSPGHRTGSRRS